MHAKNANKIFFANFADIHFASLRETFRLNNPKDTRLPEAFERRMKETLGAEFQDFRNALTQPQPTSIRVNLLKQFSLRQGKGIPWTPMGFYLDERPSFTLDPHFHAGAYYVQEASSMFLEQAVKASMDSRHPVKVLDLCAAPGGKSTHLLDLIGPDSLLVTNEVIKTRASILSENIQKWGRANVVVTNNDPKDFGALNGFFDLVVIDAPCSGEGLFRKDETAMQEWSEDNVNLCSLRQRRILGDVWPALKEDGVLIYCTCTYNEAENENNLVWLSEQKDVEFIDIPVWWQGVQKIEKGKAIGYRFMPHKIKGEGFFISAMRKLSKEGAIKIKSNPLKISKNNPGWLRGDFKYIELDNLLVAMPNVELPGLNIITRGIAVATIMKNKLVPEHALAMSVNLDENAFPLVDVNKEDALKYLSKETLSPTDNERGFALIRYEGNNLGFVNRLGNRLNNLYPANWRIRMNIRET
jgi:16S rRNA C967 or C1407 C5-methylase (RsmB/RsmF family)/NOL1/NOP2/fmu family ribosome biogenesis protein